MLYYHTHAEQKPSGFYSTLRNKDFSLEGIERPRESHAYGQLLI